jgi:SAM-dependent methyltransferase
MPAAKKMHSRELGLVLAQQLLGVEDLHYGLWDTDLELKLGNLAIAQQRYNDMLIAQLPKPGREVSVLDIGCGTGHLLRQLLDRGYRAEGVIPAKDLSDAVHRRLAGHSGPPPRIHECRFEDFPAGQCRAYYDVTLFSESFQYISPSVSLPILQAILKPGGLLLISDFFKSDAPESASLDPGFGGGHPLKDFYASMKRTPFVPVKDEDITRRVSPNMELVNDLLMNRIRPATLAIGRYVEGRYPLLVRLVLRLLRRKVDKLNHKYFSGHRSKEVFERYKTYRLLLYRLP